jgi:hypothetical protein
MTRRTLLSLCLMVLACAAAWLLLAGCYERDPITDAIQPRSFTAPAPGSYAVCWDSIEAPRQVRRDQAFDVLVTVTNCGTAIWPDLQMVDPVGMMARGAIRLYCRWEMDEEQPFGMSSDLPWPLLPGRNVTLLVRAVAPPRPGRYVMRLDFVQHAVASLGQPAWAVIDVH